MAFNHFVTNQQLQPASRLVGAVLQLKGGVQAVTDERAVMLTFIEGGDPNNVDNFGPFVIAYGVDGPDDASRKAKAQGLFFEVDSLYSKVGTDNATDHVNAAILQAVSKIR